MLVRVGITVYDVGESSVKVLAIVTPLLCVTITIA